MPSKIYLVKDYNLRKPKTFQCFSSLEEAEKFADWVSDTLWNCERSKVKIKEKEVFETIETSSMYYDFMISSRRNTFRWAEQFRREKNS